MVMSESWTKCLCVLNELLVKYQIEIACYIRFDLQALMGELENLLGWSLTSFSRADFIIGTLHYEHIVW